MRSNKKSLTLLHKAFDVIYYSMVPEDGIEQIELLT
ncbi:hypothetical protein DBB_2520 [Desulfoluna spongiiphila]|nr:hypothetical protein DBB_2520 [Desulfoluna spongiiphila]